MKGLRWELKHMNGASCHFSKMSERERDLKMEDMSFRVKRCGAL